MSTLVNQRGIPFVLSSPSGGGKTTIYKELLARRDNFFFSISATTRPPRANEKDGREYYFISEEEFLSRRAAGRFIENAEVHGLYYGTPREPLEQALAMGQDVILDVDIQGADSIRRIFNEAVLIFIVPPDMETLRYRLESRGSDTTEVIERRLKNAIHELSQVNDYHYVVINDKLEAAVQATLAIIEAEHHSRLRLLAQLLQRFPQLNS